MKKKFLCTILFVGFILSFTACNPIDSTKKDDSSQTISTIETSSNEINTEDDSVNTIVKKVKENMDSTKNYTAKMNVDMSIVMKTTIDNDVKENHMSNSLTADVKTTEQALHSNTKVTRIEDSNDPIVYEEEKYNDYQTNYSYIKSNTDEKWTKYKLENEQNIIDTSSLFSDMNSFKNATLEKTNTGYIITADLNNFKAFIDSISSDTTGAKITGKLIITTNTKYYPTCIEMKDIKFDTSEMEKTLKSYSSSEDNNSNTDLKIDINFNFKVDYTSWNRTSDLDTVPPSEITSKAVESSNTSLPDIDFSNIESSNTTSNN